MFKNVLHTQVLTLTCEGLDGGKSVLSFLSKYFNFDFYTPKALLSAEILFLLLLCCSEGPVQRNTLGERVREFSSMLRELF